MPTTERTDLCIVRLETVEQGQCDRCLSPKKVGKFLVESETHDWILGGALRVPDLNSA